MHYLLLTSSVMALIYITAEGHIQVFQKPRFFGVKTGRTVMIYCVASNPSLPTRVEWLKARAYKDHPYPLKTNQRTIKMEKTSIRNASITIKKVDIEDSGVYFCKLNNTMGPGTELQVSRHSDPQSILKRSRIKDIFIFLQGFLLILCVIVPLVLLYKQEKKEDAVYEEPEVDHTYEGLEIDHCGDIYEDISTLAPGPDAVWEVESPDQE
ncbi:B-cell antigen receptor complex-associated protein beta chain [Triplophysa rosa]|uniref:B-cell antigen receptor complex-associated protein beta chain n=1 Tax=Triplophysa rosa TaxID=992332 RepID=A0A9W7TI05_TRIRA|nr:B-cell antigen receptor complex-associated protein beta chain [Triplophysa rosa]XP_057214524.1 B-cell antigen receptor complex-associated protein beta chain [Triplophysa rosa]XP_057214525.1 B-cell antigen receptor complex-associated protein beta chain [Triplophysa rosa]KAI7796793.1 putative B-cell antigen receptor complex-associated protein beta chain [Triplophysa rosa]